MREYEISDPNTGFYDPEKNTASLGWLKLYIIGKPSSPSSRTVYVKREGKIYAVLHTDTGGGTKTVCLPASKESGTEYSYMLDSGEQKKITVYPYVVNIHYIDKNAEEV